MFGKEVKHFHSGHRLLHNGMWFGFWRSVFSEGFLTTIEYQAVSALSCTQAWDSNLETGDSKSKSD